MNVVLFATALVCFEVFLRALREWRDAVGRRPAAGRGPADWTWRLWGYAVFLPASLWMVTLRLVTPDLLVLGAVLLTAALLARVCAGRASSATFVGLGLVLGVGYLAKLAMLPIAVVTFALLAVMSLRRAGVARGAAIALAGFAVVALPWIAVLSAGMGRLSVGESAGLNYGWIVNRPEGQRIETGLTAFGTHEGLAHPPVQLLAAPAVYEFDGGVPGTVPLWRDPGYWHEGAAHALQPVAAGARGAGQPSASRTAGDRLGAVPARPRRAGRRGPPAGAGLAVAAVRAGAGLRPARPCTSRSTSSTATSARSSCCS